MKPTLSLSAPFSAPAAPGINAKAAREAAAAAAAAVTTEGRIFRLRVLSTGTVVSPPAAPARPRPEIVQRSGTKASPNDAGAADPARPRRREIAISTTVVARYGKEDMNWDGIGT